jgi:hypothetical protein
MELILEKDIGCGGSRHIKTLECGDHIVISISKGRWWPPKEQGQPPPSDDKVFPAYSVDITIGERVMRHLYFKPCDDFTTKSDDELLRLILSHITLTPSLVGSLIKDGKAQGRKQAADALRAVLEGDEV